MSRETSKISNVDIPKVTHISLCSGYGGIDIGLREAIGDNLRTIAYSEIEAFACELLLARMEGGQLDSAPIWPDIRTFPWKHFAGNASIISVGYPCQPFSTAGKRAGNDDPRHIWPYIRDGIAIVRPNMCFFENVEGHITLGLSTVISDLEELGYKVSWGIFSASEVGAPHQRKRVFILAYSGCERLQGLLSGECNDKKGWQGKGRFAARCCENCGGEEWPSRPGKPQYYWEPPRVVADSSMPRQQTFRNKQVFQWPEKSIGESGYLGNSDSKGPQERSRGKREAIQGTDSDARENANRQTKPSLGGDSNGTSGGMDYAELCRSYDNRTDELRMLGNGVVPATAAKAFTLLMQDITNGA